MSGRALLTIPAERRVSNERLVVAAPWFARTGDPLGGDARSCRPSIHTFVDDDFVEAFFDGVERSASWTGSAWTPLEPYRDFAEPPRAMLDALGRPRYPHDDLADTERLPGELAIAPGEAVAQVPAAEPDAPSWLRKLYLPLHGHFQIVAAEVVCDRRGGLPIAPGRLLEAGLVVRRLAPGTAQRWEDWVPAARGGGAWLPLANEDVAAGGEPLDPTALSSAAVAAATAALDVSEAELRVRLGLGAEDPLTLAPTPMSPLPGTLEGTAGRTGVYAYLGLPLSENERPEPPPADAQVAAMRTELADLAEAALRASLVDVVDDVRAKIRTHARVLAEQLLLPSRPTQAQIDAAENAFEVLDVVDLVEPANPLPGLRTAAREALLQAAWDAGDSDASASSWWTGVRDAARLAVADATGTWTERAVAARPNDFHVLIAEQAHALTDAAWPESGAPTTDPTLIARIGRWIGAMLRRIRAHRKELMREVYASVFADVGDGEADVDRLVDGVPVVTVSSLSSEIDAWIAVDDPEAREIAPRPWSPTDLSGFSRHETVHEESRALETLLAELDREAGESGTGYVAVRAQRRAAALAVLDPLVAGVTEDALRAVGVDVDEQPGFGLLGYPGHAPTTAIAEDFVDDVVAEYTASSDDDVLLETRARAAAPRRRFDADSLYAVWCYARVAGRDDCELEQLVWSPRSEIFSVADPLDLLGQRPAVLPMPDIGNLLRDIPRLPKARANPFAGVNLPPDSDFATGEDPEDTSREWGIAWICSFGIPVFTICAWILFKIIFSILIILPGFAWMLLLKFCIPVPVKK